MVVILIMVDALVVLFVFLLEVGALGEKEGIRS